MSWLLVGYFPKRRVTRSAWSSPTNEYRDSAFPAPPPVEQICSVSRCIVGDPDYGPEEAPSNEYGGYDSPEAAQRAIAADKEGVFDVLAYRLLPQLFRDGNVESLDISPPDVESLPSEFECLGYDAVEFTDGWGWGCSPLSCNGQTDAAAVNRFCLVATEAEGIELARRFSITKPEPGPYAVVEVWRGRTDS